MWLWKLCIEEYVMPALDEWNTINSFPNVSRYSNSHPFGFTRLIFFLESRGFSIFTTDAFFTSSLAGISVSPAICFSCILIVISLSNLETSFFNCPIHLPYQRALPLSFPASEYLVPVPVKFFDVFLLGFLNTVSRLFIRFHLLPKRFNTFGF